MNLEIIKDRFKNYRPSKIKEGGICASVLVPLIEKEKGTHIILIKRTENVKVHKGEVSFPGGVFKELDRTPLKTALRECYEEIGVKEEDVEIIGMMDDEKTTTGYIIRPFVGIIPYPYEFSLDPMEVAYLIYLPLLYLKDIEPDEISSFFFEGERIWGATGRILIKFAKIAGYRRC